MECNFHLKNEDIPEMKEVIVYGFKQYKTVKLDIYVIIECESDECIGNDNLFNFRSSNTIKKG